MNVTLAVAVVAAAGVLAAVAPPDPADARVTPVPALHSRPGAAVTVLLDFDGHLTSGTRWNRRYADGAAIATSPFDLDGSPATTSATELSWIDAVWQGVAEDFSPFRRRRDDS